MSKKKRWAGRIFLGRDEKGKQHFHWVGRFDTKKERAEAVASERVRIKAEGCRCQGCVATGSHQVAAGASLPTCDAYADRYLAFYKRHNKDSSHDTQTQRLRRFKRDFAGQLLSVEKTELRDWRWGEGRWKARGPVPNGDAEAVTSLFNHAVLEDELLAKSPARGLAKKSKGRAEEPPPTEEEFQAILDACSVLDEYAEKMRAIILFSAFQLMRPSEVCATKRTDIDFRRMRVRKAKRVYRGKLGEPKTGPKTIALTPPAQDALAGLPQDSEYLFTSKTGKRLSTNTLYEYWRLVVAAAGLDFDLYHATKHYGVHYMWVELGLSERAIAAQAGWKLSTVIEMLETYGHGDVGALDEVDAAFAAGRRGRPKLRKIQGGGMPW